MNNDIYGILHKLTKHNLTEPVYGLTGSALQYLSKQADRRNLSNAPESVFDITSYSEIEVHSFAIIDLIDVRGAEIIPILTATDWEVIRGLYDISEECFKLYT